MQKPRPMKRLWPAAAVAVIVAIASVVWGWHAGSRLPRRFATVVEGRLYRSGSVSAQQVRRLRRDYGIRRIVCLLNPEARETQAERAAAEQLGIEWRNVPLPGNGASTPAQRRQILELMADPRGFPTLVHCAAGTNRTGLAVALYRLHEQGWPLDRVLEELRAFGFEDGPQHESIRQALALEAARAASSQPLDAPPTNTP